MARPPDTPAPGSRPLALPPTVRSIAVLDRTKEPGSVGEPRVDGGHPVEEIHRVEIEVRPGWREPLCLYTVTVAHYGLSPSIERTLVGKARRVIDQRRM